MGKFDQPTTLLGDLYQYLGTIQAKFSDIATESSVEAQLTASNPNDLGDSIDKADAVLTTVEDSLQTILKDVKQGM